MPWPGIELATFRFTERHPTSWATLSEALFVIFLNPHSFNLRLGTDWLWSWFTLSMILVIYCSCFASGCHRQGPFWDVFRVCFSWCVTDMLKCGQVTRFRLMDVHEMGPPLSWQPGEGREHYQHGGRLLRPGLSPHRPFPEVSMVPTFITMRYFAYFWTSYKLNQKMYYFAFGFIF